MKFLRCKQDVNLNDNPMWKKDTLYKVLYEDKDHWLIEVEQNGKEDEPCQVLKDVPPEELEQYFEQVECEEGNITLKCKGCQYLQKEDDIQTCTINLQNGEKD